MSTRKLKKQAELHGILHRCTGCSRELKNKVSIDRKYGPKCYKKHTQY